MVQAVIRACKCTALRIVVCTVFLSSDGFAQEDETYDFDGVADVDPQPADPTDWMTQENWSDGGADPLPPFGPSVPDFGTRVEIQTSTFGVDAPEIGPGDEAEAFGVRIGRARGAGLLTVSGGTLTTVDTCTESPFTCNRRLRVGASNVTDPAERMPGTFNVTGGVVTTDTLWIGSGSEGTMNMSGGEVNTRADLSMDWTFDANSQFNFTGGTVNVGSHLRMYRNTTLEIDGGMMFIQGFAGLGYSDTNVTQTPNATVNINSGLLEANNFLQVQGAVKVDGGILRAGSFNEAASTGTIEINANGILQFNNSQESVTSVESLISGGVINTSGAEQLVVAIVEVDGTDFTQVSLDIAGLTGDFDNDGDVDGADFLAWQQGFPGSFGSADLTDWQDNYGPSSVAGVQAVPEPSSLVIALLSAIAAICSTEAQRGGSLAWYLSKNSSED